jgi:hypothetical protein
VFPDKTRAMKKKQVIDRSGVALSRCPMFLWMAPPPTSYSPARIPDETPAATKPAYIRPRFWSLGFGISLELGTWNLELLIPRSCNSLILLIIANNCWVKKKISMPQSKIRPGIGALPPRSYKLAQILDVST